MIKILYIIDSLKAGGKERQLVELLKSLNKNQDFHATGPLGVNHIVIKDKTVSIKTSPCHNQLCVRSGQISRSGQWIACLPNRIFVALEARKKDAFDAYSY